MMFTKFWSFPSLLPKYFCYPTHTNFLYVLILFNRSLRVSEDVLYLKKIFNFSIPQIGLFALIFLQGHSLFPMLNLFWYWAHVVIFFFNKDIVLFSPTVSIVFFCIVSISLFSTFVSVIFLNVLFSLQLYWNITDI